MDTQKVAAEYRLSHWTRVMQTRLDSGQSIKDFCQTTGISRNTYFYWQRKLREAACTELIKAEEPKTNVPGGWMQLAPNTVPHVAETLTIEINHCHITVSADTDPELLKHVCRALRSL